MAQAGFTSAEHVRWPRGSPAARPRRRGKAAKERYEHLTRLVELYK